MNDICVIATMLGASFLVLLVATIHLARAKTDMISLLASGGMTIFTGFLALGAAMAIPASI